MTEPTCFANDPYSREQLVGEMGVSLLFGRYGIEAKTAKHSANDIQNWIKKLKDDCRLIVEAAASAQKASDYILQKEHEEVEEQLDLVEKIARTVSVPGIRHPLPAGFMIG